MSCCIIFTALFYNMLIQLVLGSSVVVTSQQSEYLELQNGTERCQGLVKFRNPTTNITWQVCSSSVGNREAAVICRQIGCNSRSARMVNSTRFGFSGSEFYAVLAYNCSGTEPALSSCHSNDALSCESTSGSIDSYSAVAVDCNASNTKLDNRNRDLNRNLVVVIMCSIFVCILTVTVAVDIAILIYFAQKSQKRPRMAF